jgi:hypothetical protein
MWLNPPEQTCLCRGFELLHEDAWMDERTDGRTGCHWESSCAMYKACNYEDIDTRWEQMVMAQIQRGLHKLVMIVLVKVGSVDQRMASEQASRPSDGQEKSKRRARKGSPTALSVSRLAALRWVAWQRCRFCTCDSESFPRAHNFHHWVLRAQSIYRTCRQTWIMNGQRLRESVSGQGATGGRRPGALKRANRTGCFPERVQLFRLP